MKMSQAIHQNKLNSIARRAITILCIVAVAASLLFASACTSVDKKKIQGTWKMAKSDYEITVVFTENQFKSTAGTMDYELESGSSMKLTTQDGKEGSATYAFNDDYSTLTITQTDDDGKDETTEFQKVSDDTAAEPTAAKK